jgi:hypothetical protein
VGFKSVQGGEAVGCEGNRDKLKAEGKCAGDTSGGPDESVAGACLTPAAATDPVVSLESKTERSERQS